MSWKDRFHYLRQQTMVGITVQCNAKITTRELQHQCFWAMHVNRKWDVFSFNLAWRYHFVFRSVFTLKETIYLKTCIKPLHKNTKIDFRLPCVPHKRLYWSSGSLLVAPRQAIRPTSNSLISIRRKSSFLFIPCDRNDWEGGCIFVELYFT